MKERNFGLDLIRCIAISMVLVSHIVFLVFKQSIPAFWYAGLGGVDLFFSLSGFLIGKIILEDFSKSGNRWEVLRNFFFRRWMRTLPAYIVAYLAFVILNRLLYDESVIDFRYFFFVQSLTDSPAYFPESWSLAIEEWFYIFFPLLLVLLSILITNAKFSEHRNTKTSATPDFRNVYLVIVITSMISATLIRLIYYPSQPYLYGVLFRMDAISYGLLGAAFSSHSGMQRRVSPGILIPAGFAAWGMSILLLYLTENAELSRIWYYPLCGTGTTLLVWGCSMLPKLSKLTEPVAFLSKRSYSIYLVNYSLVLAPLTQQAADLSGTSKIFLLIAGAALTWGAASLLYHFIEKPFLRYRARVGRE